MRGSRGRMNGRSVARGVGRGLLVALVFGSTLEVCARVEAWWRWDAPLWGPYSHDRLRATDDLGGSNRPGARFEKWAINRAGFRGPEVSLTKPAGVVRVGVAGASEVFGLYESPEKDLTAQLRERLAALAPGRFEVVNLAAAGMSLPRIRELVDRWAGRFDFDVIVLYPTPAFYLDLKPPSRSVDQARAPGEDHANPFALRLPDKVWQAARQVLPASLQAWVKRLEVERARSAHPPDWVWPTAPPERVALFAADVLELVRAIQVAGAEAILATHAHPFSPPVRGEEVAQMDAWIRFYPRATGECLVDMERQASKVLRGIGRERSIAVVDVQEAVGKDPQHYADFSHFSDEGAARAAEALAAEILAHAL